MNSLPSMPILLLSMEGMLHISIYMVIYDNDDNDDDDDHDKCKLRK